MKHICIDARLLHGAGIGSLLQMVLKGLFKKETFKISLIIDKQDCHDSLFYHAQNLYLIESASPIYSIKEQIELPHIIPRCDLFWAPHFNIPLFPIKAKKRLVSIHDCYHLAFKKNYSFFARCYAQLFYNSALKYADHVTTLSYFSKQEIAKHCIAHNVNLSVIYLGINKDIFYIREQSELERCREKYNLNHNFILAVGNVKPHKNLIKLVQAFEIVKSRRKDDLKLVIVGKNEGFIQSDQELFSYLSNHPYREDICFTGFIPYEDLPCLYALASVFVFPSYYEGFGLPPLEAMACGTAVIAGTSASMPEICQDAAYYIDPHNAMSIAHAIILLQDNQVLKKKMVEKGHQLLQTYAIEKTQNNFINLIENLCA